MKLRDLCAVAALGLITACETPYQATDTVVIAPDGVQTAFVTQYPAATNVVWTHYDPVVVTPIDWEMAGWTTLDTDDYLVTFYMNGDEHYAWYDSDGNWIGTAYMVRDLTTLPSAISNYINTQYPGYTITSAHREFMTDRRAYEVDLKNDNTKVKLLLDENGTVLKQKTKPND